MTERTPARASPAIVIRPARLADIAAIAGIYRHAVLNGTASFEIEAPDEKEMLRRWNALRDGGYPYLVAECDGATTGYAYAGPYRARPAYQWTVEDSIYVDPQMHRHGIGRRLLDCLMTDCEALGFRQMIAVIGDSRQTPSIALHRAAGFRLIGTMEAVGFKFGGWLDTVLMQRELGPGASEAPRTGSAEPILGSNGERS
ncbi:MAG: N-acetyltransferase [Bradyrhizobiaceae bacterium]|nr:N-acetyltransferase [Bradyrhizobiaceae bacterium]